MAGYGDNSIALAVNPPAIDITSPLLAAAKLRSADQQSALNALSIQQKQRENTLAGIDYRNALIRNAAQRGAMDSDAWDREMKEAAAQGAPEAQQYVGHYNPILAQRLVESFGAPAPAARGGGDSPLAALAGGGGSPGAADARGSGGVPGPAGYDRQFQGVAPDKIAATLSRLNLVMGALSTVRDAPSWDAAIQRVASAGIPQAAQLAGGYSPLRVQQLYNQIQPLRDYLQSRLVNNAVGAPSPLVGREIKEAGGGIYALDPYAPGSKGATELVAPTMRSQYVGIDSKGNPIALDTRSGTFHTNGGAAPSGPIAAKPSAGATTWKTKYDAAIGLGYSPADALGVANGRRDLSPAEMRRSAIAAAQRDYGAAVLAGTAPPDQQKFVKDKTDEYFRQMAGTSPAGGKPSGPAKPAGSLALPDTARKALKEGQNTSFANGQVWTLKNGQPVRVK